VNVAGEGSVPRILAVTIIGLVACFGLGACKRAPESTGGPQAAAQKAGGTEQGAEAGQQATPADSEATPAGWSPAAMQIVEQLAGKVRAAGIACDEFEPETFGFVSDDYKGKIPLPAAIASCTSEDDEDITFEAFADAKSARQYIDKKQDFLCKRVARVKLSRFPGFPYVYGEGNTWVVEPDEKSTGDQLAKVLGGESKMVPCPGIPAGPGAD
jgi:hypothetical protein